MPSILTADEVERIARLAHLDLTTDEKELFAQQLGQILEYAERLQDVDTTNVSENSHPVTKSSELRSDNCLPSLETETVLAKAPERGPHGLFRVPKVIG